MVGEIRVDGFPPLTPTTCRVIAEAGVNHNNSIARAIEMARTAAEAGAWAVKYQLYKADSISVPDSPKYWEDATGTDSQYNAFKLSDHLEYDDYAQVAAVCRELGIVFFATPFDVAAIDALERMDTPIYKTASADITHKPLLEAVAATGKPLLLSTGASTVEEIRQAIEWTGLGPEKLALLVCTLSYPTEDREAHFSRIPAFMSEFEPYLIGCSDHTLGPAGAWMTAALGGVCIEKHYTLDKTLPDVPDHKLSVEPDELAEMVRFADRAMVMRGEARIGVHKSETKARENARRSIVCERDLPSGTVIAPDALGYKRPGTGIPPYELRRVVGRTLVRAKAKGEILREGDLD
jgi:N,N'-diacetyllegionaminate synthase